ncbi:LysR family substrate-binding domain-containing protein [Amnibacterium sp.]|uniref:LysR family substrate-binding domain-containing protein n=1 Tax=Amnibacterium sp. TaxID=1872496 RepID=UPI002632260A|nr:LysR family substrate-binding domain-containing protein [Amnibacterium sp.]MCU1474057.1 LysR family transcriptional regulator [Amnibacterium sp.]
MTTTGLVIGVVAGVTPDTWVRTWRDRMPDARLRVEPVADEQVQAALGDALDMVLARLPIAGVDPAELHVIPLWDETPVVVAAKDHPIKVLDTVTLADLADEELYPGWDDATLDIVAAGHGIARMPQAVLRATGRRDVVGRPITDAEPTRVGLVWRRTTEGPLVDEFIGIVRGRTVNSSRGSAEPAPPEPKAKRAPKDQKPRPKRPSPQRRRRQTR